MNDLTTKNIKELFQFYPKDWFRKPKADRLLKKEAKPIYDLTRRQARLTIKNLKEN